MTCIDRGLRASRHGAPAAQEEVYLQSAALQDDLSELFRALDKGKGTETGFVPKVCSDVMRHTLFVDNLSWHGGQHSSCLDAR